MDIKNVKLAAISGLLLIACVISIPLAPTYAATVSSKTSDTNILDDFEPHSPPPIDESDDDADQQPNNMPDSANFNYSLDNEKDTTSQLGGDIYYGSNTHLGILGESAYQSGQATGTGTATQTNTFDISLETDDRQPFAWGGEFTYYGSKDVLTEDTIHIPLIFNPTKSWSFSLAPANGVIVMPANAFKNRSSRNIDVNDSSVSAAVDYYGFKYWHLGIHGEYHQYSQNLAIFNRPFASKLFSPATNNLVGNITNYDQGASIKYSFELFDLGVAYDESQSALDDSISNTWTIKTEIFWSDNISTPISYAITSTNGTEPATQSSTPQPYPNTYTISAGLTYTFD